MSRLLVLALLLPCVAPAQWISAGVSAGVPVSQHSQNYGQGCLSENLAPRIPGPEICGPNDFLVKPYAVGATIGVRVHWGISIEGGLLYQRFHKDLYEGVTAPHGGGVNFGQYYGASADGWEFPLLARYTFMRRLKFSPFVHAGATLRHLGPFNGNGIQLDFYLVPQPVSVHFESGRDLDAAITAGAGLSYRVFGLEFAPEIRFLHWTDANFQPVQNQAMLMLGISFPAHR